MAFVLVADGQQIQQDLVEVAQSEVYAHHCNRVTRSHLRAAGTTQNTRITRGGQSWEHVRAVSRNYSHRAVRPRVVKQKKVHK